MTSTKPVHPTTEQDLVCRQRFGSTLFGLLAVFALQCTKGYLDAHHDGALVVERQFVVCKDYTCLP